MVRTLRTLAAISFTAGAFACLGFTGVQAQDKKETKTEVKKQAPTPADKPEAKLTEARWKARHDRFVEIATKGDVDLLFIGDSITQGWEGAGKDVWAKSYTPLKAANFGIGGDRTQHVLWRITEGKELEGISPKLAVMMIGTNNTGSNNAEEIAMGIKAILEEFKKQRPQMKVLLLGVFPRGSAVKEDKFAAKEKLNTKIPQINKIISSYADDKTVFYKDIGKAFLDESGNLPKEMMPDLLHLSPKGYQAWADAISDDVKKLLK
jgi:lysophospholipase L1-like esterase